MMKDPALASTISPQSVTKCDVDLPKDSSPTPDGTAMFQKADLGIKVTANNFALGHYTIGNSMTDVVLYTTRKLADHFIYFQSFLADTAYGHA